MASPVTVGLDEDLLPIPHLPQILPRFYIPPLANKPQNPILDGLKFVSFHHPAVLPPELAVIVDHFALAAVQEPADDSLWVDAAKQNGPSRSQIMSWDALRPTLSSKASPTPFLSEQSPAVFASAQYHVQPIINNPIYVSQHELFKSLKMTVLGTSSALHTWDPATESFIGHGGLILIDGKNEVVSESFMKRFLTIGTILRRLETLVNSLRAKSARAGPTIHAFAHALLSVVAYLREALAKSPPTNVDSHSHKQSYMLAAISLHYVEYEEVADALASLCNRDLSLSPPQYPHIDPKPSPLLSHVYNHLQTHLERQSPRLITACLAYILTTASRDYVVGVCRSVGLGGNVFGVGKGGKKPMQTSDMFDEDEEGQDEEGALFEEMEGEEGEVFPSFFGSELADALGTARKSLVLLRAANPDHPLLCGSGQPRREVEWLWSEEDVEAAWVGLTPTRKEEKGANSEGSGLETLDIGERNVYKPELATQFGVFDLEPGATPSIFPPPSSPANNTFVPISASLSGPVQSFISQFPSSLPALTPTLTHLNELTFAPLVSHASELSRALLGLFLPLSQHPSPSNQTSHSNLDFSEHLILLRSYILLTSHAFKSRLAAALFSDSGEYDVHSDEVDIRARARQVKFNQDKGDNGPAEENKQWAVGLAPALTDRESWPPGGADLSFLLRTVIVDSLDEGRLDGDDKSEDGEGGERWSLGGSRKNVVLEEAEWRLGFAIRDLPVGAGRDRWLNPTSIEALDFLFIDYKPPHPLNVLITPIILSKYQRLFAFILRMMRVEHVSKAFFRMTRKNTELLFPTLTSSNRLLLHFRFITHSFVTSLSSHVFDTAIRGNFDAFLARLTPDTFHSLEKENEYGFSDVFALADAHSVMLDNTLSACLLRSGQKAVGDLLRGVLELVLELGILAGDLKRGRLEEYQAAPLLEDLYATFRGKMSTLTKVLKALVDKGSAISRLQLEAAMREAGEGDSRRPPGGVESLYHLLIRLDLGEWWAGSTEGQWR